ncbi:MAG: helix-turn-helix transcriptional regulator [Candidatus Rokubacteria bacterium]|nr:helix-turn-helix transcriptional regulator [Candidatus Rokubacteria bacterium]MBI3109311.1 helix-turn-helix transcriptional regulator [Candidatus Rokubacteria bacterium]
MDISAAELRAERARRQIRLYDLAPRVGLHPTELGAMMNGRRPLRPGLAEKIMLALRAFEQEPSGR